MNDKHIVVEVDSDGIIQAVYCPDETYLVDRETTIRQYVTANPDVLLTPPPQSLMDRYSG